MSNFYIKDWYLCTDITVYWLITDELEVIRDINWPAIWFETIRYRVNEDWFFEEVKEKSKN